MAKKANRLRFLVIHGELSAGRSVQHCAYPTAQWAPRQVWLKLTCRTHNQSGSLTSARPGGPLNKAHATSGGVSLTPRRRIFGVVVYLLCIASMTFNALFKSPPLVILPNENLTDVLLSAPIAFKTYDSSSSRKQELLVEQAMPLASRRRTNSSLSIPGMETFRICGAPVPFTTISGLIFFSPAIK